LSDIGDSNHASAFSHLIAVVDFETVDALAQTLQVNQAKSKMTFFENMG